MFDKFKSLSREDGKLSEITKLLESDDKKLSEIPLLNRYHFLGFYEEISIAVNSGLIRKDVAFYMFGYFVLRCWESQHFWKGINKGSYYWSVFNSFALQMHNLEERNINKARIDKITDWATGRSTFKY